MVVWGTSLDSEVGQGKTRAPALRGPQTLKMVLGREAPTVPEGHSGAMGHGSSNGLFAAEGTMAGSGSVERSGDCEYGKNSSSVDSSTSTCPGVQGIIWVNPKGPGVFDRVNRMGGARASEGTSVGTRVGGGTLGSCFHFATLGNLGGGPAGSTHNFSPDLVQLGEETAYLDRNLLLCPCQCFSLSWQGLSGGLGTVGSSALEQLGEMLAAGDGQCITSSGSPRAECARGHIAYSIKNFRR